MVLFRIVNCAFMIKKWQQCLLFRIELKMLAEAVASTALPKVIKSFTNTYEFKLSDNFDNSYFVLSKLNASVFHCTLNCAVVVLHLELVLALPKRKCKTCLCYVVFGLIL